MYYDLDYRRNKKIMVYFLEDVDRSDWEVRERSS